MGAMETQSMTVNSTLTVVDDVTAQQDMKIDGTLYANGPAVFGGAVQVATLSGSGISQIYSDNNGMLFKGPSLPNAWACFTAAPAWNLGGNNMSAVINTPFAPNIGTCDNYDFILKANNNQRIWIKPDGKIGFGISNPGSTFGPEYQFNQGVARLSGMNSFGGPQIIFDGGAPSNNGDWGIEYLPISNTSTPGLNFWKPTGSFNSYNYLFFIGDDGRITVGNVTESNSARFNVDGWDSNAIRAMVNGTATAYSVINKTTGQVPFTVRGDGRTKIGLESPLAPHNDAMLSVDGKIVTKSLYVTKPASWADFVFKNKLKENLSEVENYINKNNRLPNIPSEKEILENGYNINEIDAKLLEKIELLYVHIIRLEKEVEALKSK
jgi:hypothetical protein